MLSEWVHSGQILDLNGIPYEWKYREMLSPLDPLLERAYFSDSYFKAVRNYSKTMKFVRNDSNV